MGKYADLLKAAKTNKTTTDLTPKFHKWTKKGQSIVGKFLSKASVASSAKAGDTYNQYMFEVDDGLTKFSLGGAADNEFQTLLREGNVYQIIFEGKIALEGVKSVNKYTLILVALGADIPQEDAE